MATPRYVTLEEMRLHVALEAYKDDQKKAMNEAIKDATGMVDAWTGTWWDSRKVKVTTSAVEVGQKLLFMPARIISVDSVTIDSVEMTAGTYLPFSSWLEYENGSSWTRKRQAIVVVGTLGHTITPGDIKGLTKDLAAALSGFKTKTYTTADGVQATVSLTNIPDWAQTVVENRAWRDQVGQSYKIEAL